MLSYQVEQFGRPLAQALRDTPRPTGTEVLLKVSACGVCHSDVHLHDGYFSMGGEQRLDMSRSVNPPRTLGHEIAGTVAAVGPEAQALAKGLKIGDRRVAFPWIGCGQCSICRRGDEHLCNRGQALGVSRDGGFADHVLVPHPRYLADPGSLPDEQACTYACAGLTAYSALKKVGRLDAEDALLIIGAGGVGLSGVRLAERLTGVAAIVAEVDASKWDIARAAGAREVIDPRADGAGRALAKATGGGVAAVVDFVGSSDSFAFGHAALRKGGRQICVGLIGGAASVVPMMISMKAVSIIGSYVGSLDEMREVLALAAAGGLPALPVAMRPLAEATQALDDLRQGKVRGRTVLRP